MITTQQIREALFALLATILVIYAISLTATDDDAAKSMQQAWDARYAANSEAAK